MGGPFESSTACSCTSRSVAAADGMPLGALTSPDQQGGDVLQRQAMIDLDVAQRARRHVGLFGVGRVLNDGGATARLDRLQAGRAVVEPAGQEHADHGSAVGQGGGAKQRVDRRSRMVLLAAARQVQRAAQHEQVMVGGRDVDPARLDALAVARLRGRQRAGRGQDLAEDARVSADVEHHQDRCREVRRQPAHEAGQGADAARRGAHGDKSGVSFSTTWARLGNRLACRSRPLRQKFLLSLSTFSVENSVHNRHSPGRRRRHRWRGGPCLQPRQALLRGLTRTRRGTRQWKTARASRRRRARSVKVAAADKAARGRVSSREP